MWKTPTAVAFIALVAAAFAAPAAADGQRGWRSRAGAWPVGAITANVITPDYVGYYGGQQLLPRPVALLARRLSPVGLLVSGRRMARSRGSRRSDF